MAFLGATLWQSLFLGPEELDSDGRRLQRYLGPTGTPIQPVVLGLLLDVIRLDDQTRVIFVPPALVGIRQMFREESDVLRNLQVTAGRDSRIILNQQHWYQDVPATGSGFIFVRVSGNTTHEISDVSASGAKSFVTGRDEVPVVAGRVDAMALGALLFCHVDPFRVDIPIQAVSSQPVFERVYGLNASLTVRLYRSAAQVVSRFLHASSEFGESSDDFDMDDVPSDASACNASESTTHVSASEIGLENGISSIPMDVGLAILGYLPLSDRLHFAQTSRGASYLASVALEVKATRILSLFDLRFCDIRIMQSATGTVISGSVISALVMSGAPFVPGDLDFFTAKSRGFEVMLFLTRSGQYCLTAFSAEYQYASGIGKVWTLLGLHGQKMNIIESLSSNPFDAIGHFHLSCVIGAWTADNIWHRYPRLTVTNATLTTAARFPLTDTLDGHLHSWRILHKYMQRSFAIHLAELDQPHTCGYHLSCPVTLCIKGNSGCLTARFPSWPYPEEASPLYTTYWSMGGTGCSKGILAGGSRVAANVMEAKWLTAMTTFAPEDVRIANDNLDGTIGKVPASSPSKDGNLLDSGLNRTTTGGYFNNVAPVSPSMQYAVDSHESSTMFVTTPRVPFARSASVAMFINSIALMPTASSTLPASFPVFFTGMPATVTRCTKSSGFSVRPCVSSASQMYIRCPVLLQCFCSDAVFQRTRAPCLGVTSTEDAQGAAFQSGMMHLGSVSSRVLSISISASVHAPTRSR
ncbi:hypothetical protein B0H17DRAFT_1209176 [Mycena rosella]|uniref:F-box domain-containing protein n=1 Tax=Mycena rosella TaxID=1033263 RepID=A0AAD7D2U7_MYCRO|nr:hypothetical protein B0H17DRAFT_1209176 [Mycena rosella]